MSTNKKQRLLILTNHFYPEDFRVNELAFELAKRNYEVTVITAIPDYPQGRFFKGYSIFKRRKEKFHDVRIIRLLIIPRRHGNALRLILNYFSYLVSSLIFIFFHSLQTTYDAVLVHMTSPFFITLPGLYLKRRKGIPLILWILDLWPESVAAAGGIKNQKLLRALDLMVKKVYAQSDKILVSSNTFRESINKKGNFADKLVYFPNWADSIPQVSFEGTYKSIEPFCSKTSSDFIFLFAGNLGEAQNIDFLLRAIAQMKLHSGVKFVFMGDGRKRVQLINITHILGLSDICFFPGRFPQSTMSYFMDRADVMLASLKRDPIFSLTVPAKVQFYMSQGKAILGVLDGEASRIIEESRCGLTVIPGDTQGFQSTVFQFLEFTKDQLLQLGDNGRLYYVEHFAIEKRISQIESLLRSVVKT